MSRQKDNTGMPGKILKVSPSKHCKPSHLLFPACKWWSNILCRNFLVLLIYLSIHLIIQALYQADMCCPPKYWQNTTADTLTNDLNRRKCRTLASLWFLRWGLLIKDMSKGRVHLTRKKTKTLKSLDSLKSVHLLIQIE